MDGWTLIKRFAFLLRALAAAAVLVLAWMGWRYGFNDFASVTDLQMLGLLILAVGLVESGRLLASFSSEPDAPGLSFGTRIVLTLAVLFLNALGSFLVLLPIVEPRLT
jgi:hypothetical protein